jgi:FtsH-binding integral membrane protein
MTHVPPSMPIPPPVPVAPYAEGEFRVGEILNRTFSVLSRNLLPFCVVTAIAYLPNLLLLERQAIPEAPGRAAATLFSSVILSLVLSALSQAIVLFGAFEDMRGRPVDLIASLKVGLARFFPVVGVALLVGLLTVFAGILLFFPAFIVMSMLFVAMPVCIVERLGPIQSLGRSSALTKGYRWKIFGLWLVIILATGVGSGMLGGISYATGPVVGGLLKLIWGALAGAFNAIMVVVAYHDLRVVKEGVDTDRIASVFD